jgi:hypothetical protein
MEQMVERGNYAAVVLLHPFLVAVVAVAGT